MEKAKKKISILLFIIFIVIIISGKVSTIATKKVSIIINENQSKKFVEQILNDRDNLIIENNEEMLKCFYDLNTKYGTWAYEYALKKMNYMKQWSQKQGIEFTEIINEYSFDKIKETAYGYSINVKVISEYKYRYVNQLSTENSFKIAVYHYMTIVFKEDRYVITKEWFSDPMCDTIKYSKDKYRKISDYIINTNSNQDKINERRKKAVEYANTYCGANGNYRYNNKYRNYNPVGGDCANFVSQVLYEGGGFKKSGTWNYAKGGSIAWIKAKDLTHFLIYSGRASKIAVGNYEQVYKLAYKLKPGDIVAYEEKGKIKHVSIVTGKDSKGYPLVNCHNIDRYGVPWDIGWNRSGVRYWLVHVHY